MSRKLLFALGFAIVLYGLVVLWQAHQSPEIGMRCAFETEIQKIYPDHFQEFPAQPQPTEEDRIEQIGPQRIETWSDVVRTLADLQKLPKKAVDPDSTFSVLEDLPERSSHIVVRGEQELIRVQFSRKGQQTAEVCWARIGPPPVAELIPSLVWFFVKMGLFSVGAIVFWKRPEDGSARRFFLLCIVTVGAYMGGYHWLRIAGSPWLVVVFIVCAILLPVLSLHFYLCFPRPRRFFQHYPRTTLLALYGLPGLFLLAMLATYATVVWTYRLRDQFAYDPATITLAYRTLLYEIYVYLVVAALLFLGCVGSLLHSFLLTQRGSLERNQVKWILAGTLLATVFIGYTLSLAITDIDSFGTGGTTWPMFAASLCITAAYGISISRYRLMEVDQVINWGILYFAVSFVAGLVYYGLVFLGTFIGSQMEMQSPFRQALWVSTTALLLLIAFDVFRWRLRLAMDRRLHREKYQLDKTLRQMSQAVEQLVDPPTLSRRFLHALAELLGFQQGAVFLREGSPAIYRLATHLGKEPPLSELPPGSPLVDALEQSPLVRQRHGIGPPPEPAQRQLALLHGEIAIPLRHEGALMAVLLAGPRLTGQYDVEELHLLTTFAQTASLALHGARGYQIIEGLNRDLKTKVEKISEQQRRIMALQSQLLRHGDRPPVAPPGEVTSAGMVGSSNTVRQLLQVVSKVAASPSAVLIRGESGTGKELLARALHDNSPRAKRGFVKVHCAALSSGLLESELFGHVKGAFTGAHRDKVGRFEMADGGTLFLDEIGDISLEVQTKLLRVLQEMTFERVGSSDPLKVDVRLIAATNQDLEKLMREGRFREDLFYRLNVITIRTPPLRERRDDIYELSLHFLKLYSRRSGKTITNIEDEALEVLKAYSWPGNIRELENVIERAVVLADGPVITMQELPEELLKETDMDHVPANGNHALLGNNLSLPEDQWSVENERLERERLVRALASAAGNKAQAARALGLPRSTLLSKLKKYGLS